MGVAADAAFELAPESIEIQLLKASLDLIPKASGRVLVFGRPYRRQRRLVAYVPQRESVDWDFPTSALDVVMMGLYGGLGWFRRPGRREHPARSGLPL